MEERAINCAFYEEQHVTCERDTKYWELRDLQQTWFQEDVRVGMAKGTNSCAINEASLHRLVPVDVSVANDVSLGHWSSL